MANNGKPAGINGAALYVWAIVVLCVLTAGFVLGISALRPNEDNTPVIAPVIGVMTTVVVALIAVVARRASRVVNGKPAESEPDKKP